MQWDLFCRVVDNHGDAGVCWRLAADLAGRGEVVRLFIDDARALAWMAPGGARGVTVHAFDDPAPDVVGDVVVEAFGCDPPAHFVGAMAARRPAPVWINLEYLSAEDYVERSHGLSSPVAAGRGLAKWFFYPGFTPRTGGLLREPGLLQARAAFERLPWLAAHGWAPAPGERVVSLFGYENPALGTVSTLLADSPTLLLAAPGPLRQQLHAGTLPGTLRVVDLPWLTQPDYDRLLWSCDLNAVRGEDSFVRAQWAGAPFLWQIYPQHDGVHARKLEAFVDRLLHGAAPTLADPLRATLRHWNGLGPPPPRLPPLADWAAWVRGWRDRLAAQRDLTGALIDWCACKSAGNC